MKDKRSCGSSITLSILLVCWLFVATGLAGGMSGKIQPAGTNVGAVQFDAVIELNRYSPRSARHDYTVMFVRYWVARDYYAAAVVWAEPQSTDLFFAVHPPSLSVASNDQAFKVCHESIKMDDEAYKKPLGERGVLRHKFGSYPIGNIRFAEPEALAQRVYVADLGKLKADEQCSGEAEDIPVLPAAGENARDAARLKVRSDGQRIDSMQLFNAEQRLLKTVDYEYESKGDKPRLCRQTVILPERPMMVGFNGKGMRVTLDGKEYWHRDLQAKHHAGGRTCTVEYGSVMLGDGEVTLPVRAAVRNTKDGQILRCVRMMNFKQIELDATGAEEAARQFGSVVADQRRYEELRLKYWKKSPAEIEKADLETIEQLRSRFEKAAATAGSTGERLKYLNILKNLNVILGDRSGLERHYRAYLSTLAENKLDWMTLVGGYGVIETLMFAERRGDAERLLNLWVSFVLDAHDSESILLFGRRQLARNRLWSTALLLDALSKRKQCPVETRFEAHALRCSALDELYKLLGADDIAKKGLIAEVQAAWVRSIGKDGVSEMLAAALDQAGVCFAAVAHPTKPQQVLKKRLDQIKQ